MRTTLNNKLVLAISSRALFDLSDSHYVFETEGVEAYYQYQIANEDKILEPGIAYPLVKKLLALNTLDIGAVEIILLSRNSADTGLRIFNAINHYGLSISRAVFTGGATPYRYAEALGAQLFTKFGQEVSRTGAIDDVLARHAVHAGCSGRPKFEPTTYQPFGPSGMHASGVSRRIPLLAPVAVSTRLGTRARLTMIRPPLTRCRKRSSGGTIEGPTLAKAGLPAIFCMVRPTTPSTANQAISLLTGPAPPDAVTSGG